MTPRSSESPSDRTAIVAALADLRDADPEVRWNAVAQLTAIGPDALPTLRSLAEDPDRAVRYLVLTALGWIGDRADADLLAERAVSDTAAEVRYAALIALDLVVPRSEGTVGVVADALGRARDDADDEVRGLAIALTDLRTSGAA